MIRPAIASSRMLKGFLLWPGSPYQKSVFTNELVAGARKRRLPLINHLSEGGLSFTRLSILNIYTLRGL
ncbi:MAG: hypothetical protein P8Y60_11130 [Calditrichota bacterium]